MLIGASCTAVSGASIADLTAILFGPDPALWREATRQIGKFGNGEALRVLEKAGRSHPDRATRSAARREARHLRRLL